MEVGPAVLGERDELSVELQAPSHSSCNRAAGADVVNGAVPAQQGSDGPPDAPWDEAIRIRAVSGGRLSRR